MGKAELRIEVDEALLRRAEAAGVPVERVVEEALKAAISEEGDGPGFLSRAAAAKKADPEGAEARARKWAEENAEAIKAYNERIERRGVFGADLRRW
jgi:antitoxin CcdA